MNITVHGGVVNANGGASAAGIGAGAYGSGGYVTVDGGTVNAIAGSSASGIKTGSFYVSGGIVTANAIDKVPAVTVDDITVAQGAHIGKSDDGTAWSQVVNDTALLTNLDGQYAKIDARILFDNAFGNTDCKFEDYTKGTSYEIGSGSYHFAGWFNGGNQLTAAANAVCGTTYTAKWKTASGKTVITTPLDFTAGNDASVYANETDGVQWDAESQTLTLNGAFMDITGDATDAIVLGDGAKLVIQADSSVTIRNTGAEPEPAAAIRSAGSLEIGGAHKLNVNADSENGTANAVAVNGELTYDETALTVTAKHTALLVQKNVVIDGGKLKISSKSAGIWAKGDVEINDGTVQATATGNAGEDNGINSQTGDIIIRGGKVTAVGTGYGIRAEAGDILIQDGAAELPPQPVELLLTSTSSTGSGNPVVIAKGDTAAYFVGTGKNLIAKDFTVKANQSKNNDGSAIEAVQDDDGKVNGAEEAKYIKLYKNICSYSAQVRADEEPQLLIVNDRETQEFVISGSSKTGFRLAQNDRYLALDHGEVKTQADPFTWKYDGGLYTEVKATSRVRVLFWSFTTTKVTKNYLTYDGSAFGISGTKVNALVSVTAEEHDYNWLDNQDGTHTGTCRHCGDEITEEHDFVESRCEKCGALDATVCRVTGVKVTEKAVTSRSGFLFRAKKTAGYRYTLKPETQNIGVKKVQYSLNGKKWVTGTVFTADTQLNEFYIKVTDTSGNVTNWVYRDRTVSAVNR